jgi:hypothetical protein
MQTVVELWENLKALFPDDEFVETINYKGFTAAVFYSPTDKVYWCKILVPYDSMTDHVEEYEEIEGMVQGLIDDYIDLLNRLGRSPKGCNDV